MVMWIFIYHLIFWPLSQTKFSAALYLYISVFRVAMNGNHHPAIELSLKKCENQQNIHPAHCYIELQAQCLNILYEYFFAFPIEQLAHAMGEISFSWCYCVGAALPKSSWDNISVSRCWQVLVHTFSLTRLSYLMVERRKMNSRAIDVWLEEPSWRLPSETPFFIPRLKPSVD